MVMTMIVVAMVVYILARVIYAWAMAPKANPREAEESAEWLQTMKSTAHVHALPSGLLFKIVRRGKGTKSPELNDPCEVHYTGRLRDGTKFDSSYDRHAPATFSPSSVISGWTEAMQLMREGDMWELYIPSTLAYGTRGAGGVIPGNAALHFRMELLKVKGAGKTAEAASALMKAKVGSPYEQLSAEA